MLESVQQTSVLLLVEQLPLCQISPSLRFLAAYWDEDRATEKDWHGVGGGETHVMD